MNKAEVTRTEKWPVGKDKLITKYYINFKRFTDNLILENEWWIKEISSKQENIE